MMRTQVLAKLTVIVPMLLGAPLIAQIESSRTPYERAQVVHVDSTRTADALFATARNWFIQDFKYTQGEIQFDDPVEHTIVAKGTMPIEWEGSTKAGVVTYTMEVRTKAGRYRVRFHDLHHSGTASVIGRSTVPAFNMGLIYAPALCYTAGPISSNTKKEAKKLARVKEDCADGLLPQIEVRLDDLSRHLEVQMRTAASAPAKDIW
jgi:hypothetical protein